MSSYIQYRVVRSYATSRDKNLQEAFDAGWQFVRASEFIPENKDHCGYIEYILVREIQHGDDK